MLRLKVSEWDALPEGRKSNLTAGAGLYWFNPPISLPEVFTAEIDADGDQMAKDEDGFIRRQLHLSLKWVVEAGCKLSQVARSRPHPLLNPVPDCDRDPTDAEILGHGSPVFRGRAWQD